MRANPLVLLASMFAPTALAGDQGLGGVWLVALSTEPGKAYTRPMHLQLDTDGGNGVGSFPGSTIEAGRRKKDRVRLCTSYRTTDGEGPYHTAACQTGGTATGQALAEHRNLLFTWNATRAAE